MSEVNDEDLFEEDEDVEEDEAEEMFCDGYGCPGCSECNQPPDAMDSSLNSNGPWGDP